MKRMTKIISILTVVLMSVQLVCPVFAVNTERAAFTQTEKGASEKKNEGTYGNFTYVISDGEVTITGYVTEPKGILVIPETIEGYPVTTIGERAFRDCSLSSVEMPQVQTIGDGAFAFCTGIWRVQMPKVQIIGADAFHGCRNLEKLQMPQVQIIGAEAFMFCDSITTVEMPNVKEVAGNSFSYTNWYYGLTDEFCIFGDGVLVKYCGDDTDVTVPENVKCVAGFYGNKDIQSVQMPQVQIIGASAFSGCESLVSVQMPQVQSVGDSAFRFCYSLTSVQMPQVQTIGFSVFSFCKSLTSVIISPDNENYWADGGMLCNKDKSTLIEYPSAEGDIKIADSVRTIAAEAFSHCYDLTSIDMPCVQTISFGAFNGCSALKSVVMPCAQTIDDEAFYNCGLLTSVSMPQAETIGYNAFFWCESLISLELPSVQIIGQVAFLHCSSLTSIQMPQVQSIGLFAFRDCISLTSIIISHDNENYSADGGILYNGDKSLLIAFPSAKGDIVLADSVQTIERAAFYDCRTIVSIQMPCVRTIHAGAFTNCDSMVSVSMPQVQTLDNHVFSGCNALVSVSMPQVQTIGAEAFWYCNYLTSVEMPQVQTIGAEAFYSCNSLASVKMPQVQTIGNRAFIYCKFLSSAYFYSDAPTSFGDKVFEGCADNFTIYYAEGTSGWSTPTWNGYTAYPFAGEVTGITLDKTEAALKVGETVQLTATVTPENAANKNVSWASNNENVTTVSESGLVTAISAGTATITVTTEDGGYIETCEVTVSELNVYTVTFVDHDGTVLSTQQVQHGDAAQAPADPTRKGYTFTGWDKDFTNVTEDMTVTAQYGINTYTVTFQDHDGTVLSIQQVEHGNAAQAPADPTREGYTFTSWDKDFSCVTSDMTVTAQYEANTPTGVHGDLTGDGVVNTADAVSLLKLAAGMIELTPEQEAVADVNRDGKVNTADAVMILKFAAGIIDEL